MDKHLTHLMSAKICHDMATPLSAMNLLLDFAFEHCKDPHIEATFRESLEKASLRLQFYRLLLTISEEQPLYSDVHSLLTQCGRILKVKMQLPDECPDGTAARLLLGLAYVLCESLTHGGSVTIKFDDDRLILIAEGNTVQLRPGYIDAFEATETTESNARNILPIYLSGLAKELDINLKIIKVADGQINIETFATRKK